MKLFEAFYLVLGAFGCSKGADYYELDVDARDQSGADNGRGYKLFFPQEGGIRFGYTHIGSARNLIEDNRGYKFKLISYPQEDDALTYWRNSRNWDSLDVKLRIKNRKFEMDVTNNFVSPSTINRYVSTDAFNNVFKVDGEEIEIMLTRNPSSNTIDGRSIDDIEISDEEIKAESTAGFSLSRIRMQWICTSEGDGPCNSAFFSQLTPLIICLTFLANILN